MANAPLVIGLMGRAGSGKSTVASMLAAHYSFTELAFADPLKDMLYALFTSCDVPERFWEQRAFKEVPTPLGPSYRKLMQTLGTEWGRVTLAPDFWLRVMERRLDHPELVHENVVISDIRFPNEAEFVKARGGVLVRVLRQDPIGGAAPFVSPHASETQLDAYTPDTELLNFGSLDTLADQVDRLVADLRKRANA